MQSTPDLSKIVNLIMQNPDLIQQISALASAEADETPEAVDEVVETQSPEQPISTGNGRNMRAHRHELLSAMKPYLSESRRTAIDAMASILDIIDVMVKK